MKATVTKTDFKAWLEAKSPSNLAGIAADPENCPLAKYFQEINETKKKYIEVNGEVIVSNKDGKSVKAKLKPWMSEFIGMVDEWPENEEKNPKGSKRISVKKALEILAEC